MTARLPYVRGALWAASCVVLGAKGLSTPWEQRQEFTLSLGLLVAGGVIQLIGLAVPRTRQIALDTTIGTALGFVLPIIIIVPFFFFFIIAAIGFGGGRAFFWLPPLLLLAAWHASSGRRFGRGTRWGEGASGLAVGLSVPWMALVFAMGFWNQFQSAPPTAAAARPPADSSGVSSGEPRVAPELRKALGALWWPQQAFHRQHGHYASTVDSLALEETIPSGVRVRIVTALADGLVAAATHDESPGFECRLTSGSLLEAPPPDPRYPGTVHDPNAPSIQCRPTP